MSCSEGHPHYFGISHRMKDFPAEQSHLQTPTRADKSQRVSNERQSTRRRYFVQVIPPSSPQNPCHVQSKKGTKQVKKPHGQPRSPRQTVLPFHKSRPAFGGREFFNRYFHPCFILSISIHRLSARDFPGRRLTLHGKETKTILHGRLLLWLSFC